MIEYLNAMSGAATSVIAVEYSRLRQRPLEILMPRTYGQELAEAKAAPESRNRVAWDENSFRTGLRFQNGFPGQQPADHQPQQCPPRNPVPLLLHRERYLRETQLHPAGETAGGTWARTALESFLAQLEAIPELQEVAVNLRASDFTSRNPNVKLSALSAQAYRRIMDA